MAAVSPNGSGLFQHYNASCHTCEKFVQESFEEHDLEFTLGIVLNKIFIMIMIFNMMITSLLVYLSGERV